MADPALDIRDLRFAHQGGGFALAIPAYRLEAGEQALLAGGSGRGKSTLLQLIAGLRDVDAGSIEVAGIRITSLAGAARDRARGRRIGMIFQTFNLLHGFSALENVMAALMFGDSPPSAHAARAQELLGSLGIPNPSAPVDRLSVGQQQRVAVARALAAKPALVLADEPTASLDPENAVAAMDLIQDACCANGAALLCTSHDPAMRARFTRIDSVDAFVTKDAA